MSSLPKISSRPRVAIALLWSVPVLTLLDAAFAYAVGWRPEGTIEAALLLVWSLWAGSAAVMLHPALRARIGGLWRELILLVIATTIGWASLEGAAHYAEASFRPDAPLHTRGANLRNTIHPDPAYINGIEGPSRFTTGPDGLRAAAPPGDAQTCRVVSIGGSTTECVYLDDTETWSARLPAHLGAPELAEVVWIGNAGISGLDLRDHIQFAKESPALGGAAALVVQPGINDCWRYLAKEVDAMDYGRFEEAPAKAPSAPAPRRPLWANSRLIQLYHTLRRDTTPPEQQEGIGGREYQLRRDKRAAAEKTDDLPPLDEGLSRYRARIEALIDACERRSVPVLFTTQPVVWRSDLSREAEERCWFGWLPDGRYLTLAALREVMDHYNETLRQTCAARGVPCVDLSPLNGSEAYFYDDCHFTEAGAEAVARLVGPALAALLQANL